MYTSKKRNSRRIVAPFSKLSPIVVGYNKLSRKLTFENMYFWNCGFGCMKSRQSQQSIGSGVDEFHSS